MNERASGFWRIFLWFVVLLLSILFLVSLLEKSIWIYFDYHKLQTADLTFGEIIRLQFPTTTNLIGPFGAFFAYWFSYLLGKYFSLALFLGTTLLGFFLVFQIGRRNLLLKIISFWAFVFFGQQFMMIMLKTAPEQAFQLLDVGIIPIKISTFLIGIFGETGTLIIAAAIILTAISVIFEVENIKKIFLYILGNLWRLLRSFFTHKEKSSVSKMEKKPKAKKKEEMSSHQRKKETVPNIIDHVGTENDDDERAYKPKIPKRKLSQNPAEMPEEPTREYEKPDVNSFLISTKSSKRNREEIEKNIKKISKILEQKLAEFSVDAEVINVNIGPIITQYEIKPAPGVKVSKFHSLVNDLALAIKAKSIRVQAPIPGRGLIGIEIPNIKRDTIFLKDIMLSEEMRSTDSVLAFALGKDISGNSVIADLAGMPHLLIAGATGSGKSVCVNTIINSLLFRATPEEVRLVLIDPKRIELSGYEGIPHLIQNVVTNNDNALAALNWGVVEMERRYELLQKYKVRNLAGYNREIKRLRTNGEEPEDSELPYIIIVVDEFADLMMTVGKDVERPITRLAQMARAIGVHLILATQRPSTKVITGIIKANFPSRIAFKVSTKIDSRVIIDANGAEKLLGKGDMLFLPPGKGTVERIHGAFISDTEIQNVVEYLRTQPKPEQDFKIISDDEETELENFEYDDELFPEAAVAVVTAGNASVSMLQRHFKIGYARAGRLIDMLEQAGIIGPHVGSKSREVLATEEDLKIYGYLKDV